MAAPELDGPEDEGLEEGLFSHLIELRSRLMKAIVAVLVVLAALIPFANRLYTELAAPLVSRLPQGAHLKRLARPLLVAALFLFYLGCAFAYFLVLPAAFRFLTAVTPQGVEMMTDITHYLDFVMLMFFAFGLCFEVPVAVVILAAIGVVSLEQLRNGRRYAIVGAFAIAAFITPPDITSMIMLAVPMCLLYELGVLAVRWLLRPTAAEAA